jgi:hypothetical protein
MLGCTVKLRGYFKSMKVLFDAIYAKFTAIQGEARNSFYTDMGGRMYFMRAVQDAVFPYCVYRMVSNMYEYQFSEDFENITLQFSIFSIDESAVNVEKYFTDLKTLYDWCTLSITGYTHVYMRREQSRLLLDERAWHRAVDYRVFIEKVN